MSLLHYESRPHKLISPVVFSTWDEAINQGGDEAVTQVGTGVSPYQLCTQVMWQPSRYQVGLMCRGRLQLSIRPKSLTEHHAATLLNKVYNIPTLHTNVLLVAHMKPAAQNCRMAGIGCQPVGGQPSAKNALQSRTSVNDDYWQWFWLRRQPTKESRLTWHCSVVGK